MENWKIQNMCHFGSKSTNYNDFLSKTVTIASISIFFKISSTILNFDDFCIRFWSKVDFYPANQPVYERVAERIFGKIEEVDKLIRDLVRNSTIVRK